MASKNEFLNELINFKKNLQVQSVKVDGFFPVPLDPGHILRLSSLPVQIVLPVSFVCAQSPDRHQHWTMAKLINGLFIIAVYFLPKYFPSLSS
jgi:hypothetical protein